MHGCYELIGDDAISSYGDVGAIITMSSSFMIHPSSMIILFINMHHHHFPLKLYWLKFFCCNSLVVPGPLLAACRSVVTARSRIGQPDVPLMRVFVVA